MVDAESSSISRGTIQVSSADDSHSDRRVEPRLGLSLQREASQRVLDSARAAGSHQRAGDEGAGDSVKSPGELVQKPGGALLSRQLDSSELREFAGGDAVASAHAGDASPGGTLRKFKLYRRRPIHSGSPQRVGRYGIAPEPSAGHGVAPQPTHVPVDLPEVAARVAYARHVCEQAKLAAGSVLLAVPGRECDRDRRSGDSAPSGSALRLSADGDDCALSGALEVGNELPDIASCSKKQTSNVVSGTVVINNNGTTTVTTRHTAVMSTSLAVSSPRAASVSTSPVASSNALLKGKGFSENVLKRMSSARAKSTNRVYSSQWNVFEQYCKDRKLNAFAANGPVVADFLTHCFETRASSPRTLQGYRSALAATLKCSTGYDPGQDQILSQLLKSFFREKPIVSRKLVPWSLNLVLRYLKFGKFASNNLLTLRELTLKTVFLLTLATGKRCGEIHALDAEIFRVNGNYDEIVLRPRPDFLGKTHFATGGSGTFSEIRVPALHTAANVTMQDLILCPVRTLRLYRERTEAIRSAEQKRLFISFMPAKTNDITKHTIANYLRWLVQQAYSETANDPVACADLDMRPHDVRGLATTLKSFASVSMIDIMAAGVWSSMDTFLRYYVKEFTHSELTELYALAPFVVASTIFD